VALSSGRDLEQRDARLVRSANRERASRWALCIFVYRVLRSLGATVGLGLSGALLLGFSATWWRFASDADPYIPSIFLLLCSYLLLLEERPVALAGLACAGAMLFHELAILFLPVALICLRKNRRSRWTFTFAALVPTALAYVIAYWRLSSQTPQPGFVSWITSHSADSAFSFNLVAGVALSLRGTLRLFFGGKPGDLIGHTASKTGVMALALTASSFLLSLRFKTRPALLRPRPELLIWCGSYAVFLLFWMPQNTFYRLFYLPALIGLSIGMLAGYARASTIAGLFAATVTLWNFLLVAYPESRTDFNAPLKFALMEHNIWSPGTPILYRDFQTDLWTISYFNLQASWIGIDRVDIEQLNRELTRARADRHTLWIEASAHEFLAAVPEGRGWLAAHEQPAELIRFHDAKHEFRFYCVR
jgi:hypothetical protein